MNFAIAVEPPPSRRPIAALTSLTVALTLTGCAAALNFRPPAFSTPDSALQSRASIVSTQAALSGEPAPTEWWHVFEDPLLVTLQAEAADQNLEMQTAVVRIEESRAQLGVFDAAREPKIGVLAGYTRAAQSESSPLVKLGAPTSPSDSWVLGGQSRWELDLWGYLRYQSESAQARLQASGYSMAAVKVSVAGDVARSYLMLRGVQAQLRIGEEDRLIGLELARMTESRQRHGVATRFDTATARAEVATIEARLVRLHHEREALMNALALLLGNPPRELDERLAEASFPKLPQRMPIGVPSELARHRPDILRAEAMLRAAVADIGTADADFYPRITLTGAVGVQGADGSELSTARARWFSVGPSVYLPVFDGGRLKSKLALSEARHRLAGIAYQHTVLRAWHEVDDALLAYVAERERHERLEIAQEQNQIAADVARRAYQEGTADFVSILIAQRRLTNGRLLLADSATACSLTVVALYRALGGGWSNEWLASVTRNESPS